MPRFCARAATQREVRPVIMATSTPLAISIFRPWPSWELKRLNSSPESDRYNPPSVMIPSTSNAIRRISLARLCSIFPPLNNFGVQEVVHVECADQLIFPIHYQHLVDAVLLHHLHHSDGQGIRTDAAR